MPRCEPMVATSPAEKFPPAAFCSQPGSSYMASAPSLGLFLSPGDAFRAAYNSRFLAPRGESMNISGRVALVTGASQGIGRSCALKLASTGATVALAARSQEKLDELAREITAAGGKAAAFTVDVSDEAQIKSACKAAITQFGKIDILVNNAGITRDQLV